MVLFVAMPAFHKRRQRVRVKSLLGVTWKPSQKRKPHTQMLQTYVLYDIYQTHKANKNCAKKNVTLRKIIICTTAYVCFCFFCRWLFYNHAWCSTSDLFSTLRKCIPSFVALFFIVGFMFAWTINSQQLKYVMSNGFNEFKPSNFSTWHKRIEINPKTNTQM